MLVMSHTEDNVSEWEEKFNCVRLLMRRPHGKAPLVH